MRLSMLVRLRICIIMLLAALLVPPAAAVPSRPKPQRLVNDLAGIFTVEQAADLERRLVALDDSTSNQIVILTVDDLEGYAPAEFAVRVGLSWGVGSKDFDNGAVLLVKPKTSDSGGKVSIQVGYGLEGAIPDAYCRRIIENDMIPYFREEDYYGGVSAAVDILSALASGEVSVARGDDGDGGAGYALAALILFLFIVWLLAKHGGRKGGGGGGRYSTRRTSSPDIFFGPAPGSFGGSGRSGGSFGGFGGGSFGGGGASGSW